MGVCASLFWLEASPALALASQGLSGPRHGSRVLCAGADCFTESGEVVPRPTKLSQCRIWGDVFTTGTSRQS